jgi:histidinol phosphatase-like enzyme
MQMGYGISLATTDILYNVWGVDKMNYIFYVSDKAGVNNISYSHKMGTERDIAARMAEGLGSCRIRKYTDYHGEYMDCESVGIVFSSKRWGLSLAVNSFLKSIRTSAATYVYAVAVNETLAGSVDADSITSIKALEQIKNDFKGRLLDVEKDIYIRSNDRVRTVVDTEYDMLNATSSAKHVKCMMNALLYHNLNELKNSVAVGSRYMYNLRDLQSGRTIHVEKLPENAQDYEFRDTPDSWIRLEHTKTQNDDTHRLSNVFLDDDVFAEDKICRVI